MTPPRSAPAQQGPPGPLDGLPTVRPTGVWYRQHARRDDEPDRGCWWFASVPADPAAGGRFDLPAPQGTCYLADDPVVAAMELVGRLTAQGRPVPADLVHNRVVTTLDTDVLPGAVADLLAPAAAQRFGVTGELFTMPDYAVPQAWAAAVRAAGHRGLRYTPRFSPSGRAIAVFGPAGAQPRPVGPREWVSDVLAGAGVAVEPIPSASALRIVAPPGTP